MKLKKFLLIIGIAVIFLFSCDSHQSYTPPVYEGQGGGRQNGKFYTENMTNGTYYALYADKVYEGTNCDVWVEKNKGINTAAAIKAGKEFDGENIGDGIYAKLKPVFGFDSASLAGVTIPLNTLKFANWFCFPVTASEAKEKITILILDINDGNDPDVYTAGYFWAMDFFGADLSYYNESWYSNECPMLYINKKLLAVPEIELYTTIAHETQHLMNFTGDLAIRSPWSANGSSFGLTGLNIMDTWINEGLSSAAEYIYSGVFSEERVTWFNSDYYKTITKGNNFFVWAPYNASTPSSILDDYATVYYFFQWLRIKKGGAQNGATVYNDIIKSTNYDVNAILGAAKAINSSYNSWENLLGEWLKANYADFTSTKDYGVIDKDYLIDKNSQPIKKSFFLNLVSAGTSTSTWPLAPGEGVYTNNDTVPTGSNEKIVYALLSGLDLLSYNKNTDTEGSSLPCKPFSSSIVTADSLDTDTGPVSRSITKEQQPLPGGPYAISAGDMLMINGYKDNTSSLYTLTIDKEIRKSE